MTASHRQFAVVVVADDFSAGAMSAIVRALALPLARHATLHVLHVVPRHASKEHQERALDEARLAAARREGDIAAAVARREGHAVETRTLVVCGDPHVEIIRHARALGADLILVGTHAGGPPGFWGSTAERVVRKGDVPVLVVKKEPRARYRNAVAAIDVADTAPRVVELALTLVPADGAVTIFHSYDVAFEEEISGGVREVIERNRRACRDERRAACERLLGAVRRPGTAQLQIAVERGDPRVEVLRQVSRRGVDLLVVGTHARSGIAHALLGSVAESLLRSAPCDVAVTRPARFTFEMP